MNRRKGASKPAGFLFSVWSLTWRMITSRPRLFAPFACVALVEFTILALIFLSPRPPFVEVLGPPIRRFFSENYLHYPMNLVLLPHLFRLAQVPLSLLFGTWMAACTAWMAGRAALGEKAPFPAGVSASFRRFPAVVIVGGLSFSAVKLGFGAGESGVLKLREIGAAWPLPDGAWVAAHIGINFLAGAFIEGLLVFALPALMVEGRSLFGSLWKSLKLFAGAPWMGLRLVGVPLLFYLPVIISLSFLPALMENTVPEVSLWTLAAGVVLSVLANTWLVVSATVALLARREAQQKAPEASS